MRWDQIGDLTCSVARSLSVVGDRWTMLVLRDAFLGVRRFDDFQRDLGTTRHRLADRLRKLVASGIASTVGSATGFRLRPGGGVTLRLRFARRSPPPPLHFLARRPQSEAYAHNWWDHVIRIHTKKIQNP